MSLDGPVSECPKHGEFNLHTGCLKCKDSNPLTKEQHLIATLMEECAEVQQVCGKILRFGLNDAHAKTGNVPNIKLLIYELDDLMAVAQMLQDVGVLPKRDADSSLRVSLKKAKVEAFINYAKQVGTVI